jgi:hypothetical protein
LRAIFNDHPSLHKYIMLNEQENISTVDELVRYYNSGRYRPQEFQEDVLLITALMIVLNAQRAVKGGTTTNVAQLPIFGKVLRDIK